MDATFHAPKLGTVDVPLGLDGPGTITWAPDGITVSGLRHNPNTGSIFGLLGFVVGVVLAGVVGWVMVKVQPDGERRGMGLPAGAFLAGVVGTIAVGRKVVKPKPVSFTVAWSQVKKVKVDPQTQLASFVAKGAYKGQVQVQVAGKTPQVLIAEWTQAGLPHGLEV